MISLATLRSVRYPPELLPSSHVIDLAAGSLSPPLIELANFRPLWVRLLSLTFPRDADVEYRLRADDREESVSLAGVLNGLPGPEDYLATEYLRLSLYSSTPKTAFTGLFHLLVFEPTVADKLHIRMASPRRKARLDAEDERLAGQLGLTRLVSTGYLPLPRYPDRYGMERLYEGLRCDRKPVIRTVSVSDTDQVVAAISAERNEFAVLSAIAMTPGTAAQGITVTIDRDGDLDYLLLPALPFSLDRDVPCWIPARRELRVRAKAAAAATLTVRLTVAFYREADLHRVAWGLLTRDQSPDLWARVRAGIPFLVTAEQATQRR